MWDVKPGDKVICINSTFTLIQQLIIAELPELYSEYTIREIELMYEQPNVRLEEIVNPPMNSQLGMIEPAFHLNRFRPVTKFDKSTDIKLFKDILTSVPKDAIPDDEEYLSKKEKVKKDEIANSGITNYSGRSH